MSESEPDIRIDRDRFVEEILASRRNQAQKISSSSKAEIAKPLFQLNRKRRHLNQDALSESDDEENDLEIVEVIKPSSEIDGELRVSSSSPKTNSKKSKAQSIESSDDEDFQREFKAAEAKAKCQIVESGFSVYSQEDYQRIREISLLKSKLRSKESKLEEELKLIRDSSPIIEQNCPVTLGDENDSADELERNSDVSPEIIQLSFKLSRSKAPISVRVLKSHTFEQIKIMLEGATSTKIKSFRFDGDLIELNQTPTDLDLEDDDQIDTKLHEQ